MKIVLIAAILCLSSAFADTKVVRFRGLSTDTTVNLKDGNTTAQIDIVFGEVPEGTTPNEEISVTLRGTQVYLSSKGTGKFIVELANLGLSQSTTGGATFISGMAFIKLHSLQEIKSALKMSNALIRQSVLTYDLGPINGLSVGHYLSIVDEDFWSSDDVFYMGDMVPTLLDSTATSSTHQIAFRDLIGQNLGEGKYKITIKSYLRADSRTINPQEVGDISTSKVIIYKIH